CSSAVREHRLQPGARTERAFQRQRGAELAHTLLDVGEPAAAFDPRGRPGVDVEALAVILDDQRGRLVAKVERQGGTGCFRVLEDVGERLLNDAKKGDRNFRRKLL